MTTREHIIKDLIDTKHAFDSTGIPFLLYHGNLLGLVKYGDIMEWDTDIDLAVTRTVTDYDKGMLTADMLATRGCSRLICWHWDLKRPVADVIQCGFTGGWM
jgi:hypothetical protein